MSTQSFCWRVERFSHFKGHLYVQGWAFHQEFQLKTLYVELPNGKRVKTKGYGLASPDVEAVHGDQASKCRFSLRVALPDAAAAARATLVLSGSGRSVAIAAPTEELGIDPVNGLFPRFQEMIHALDAPTVVEIGSRARSGTVNNEWLSSRAKYIGFDIVDGPNVDVIGDADDMARHFEASSIDAAYSVSTFEHLAMPWRVVAQLNQVLKIGAVVFVASHQTWPLHDSPWDFWRFSEGAWHSLFNTDTGFEVMEVAMGEGACIVADYLSASTTHLDLHPAFLGSGVIARKTADVHLSWNVDPRLATDRGYPK